MQISDAMPLLPPPQNILRLSFDTHDIPRGGRVWKDVELRNVVAILPGKQDKDRWILISGHYDSLNLRVPAEMRGQPEKSAELPAPGVSDDASGTACAMECARVLSRYEFNATLVFVAFAGEEQGLIGAHAMAKRLKRQMQEIEAVLNNDIIGNDTAGNGLVDNKRVLVFSEDPNDSPSRQLARFVHRAAERYYPELTAEPESKQRRHGAFGNVEQRDAEGDLEASCAPDVRRSGAAAPFLADVDALQQPRQPVTPGHAAEEITGQDQENVRHSEPSLRDSMKCSGGPVPRGRQ